MMNTDNLHTEALEFSKMSDEEISASLKKHNINLQINEARQITKLLGRDPTITEAVIWGIQGSEHCSYKSSGRFLKTFPVQSSRVILGPGEDSGIVAITEGPKGKRWGLVISHESHNHPSQIVPFEGAATGIGGVVRDVVCMGARVIGCMDMLRLGDLKTEETRAIACEVVRGIAGYGNPLGIPNLGGDTVFDSSYNSNCLVNAIALGIVREDEIIHSFVPSEAGKKGYDIIIVGKPTDRSGFGGASFASLAMDEGEKEKNTGAVQEPNPFLERHLLASTYALFDWLAEDKKLDKVSFKDLGAGGVVCSTVEQVASAGLGADIDLDKVHVSIKNLPPEVIACAETQERFCWICHPDLTQHILNHYNSDWDLPSIAEGARASLVGKVTNNPIYTLTHKGKTVAKAKSLDITCGLSYKRNFRQSECRFSEPDISCEEGNITVKIESASESGSGGLFKTSIDEIFKAMLAHPNCASVEPVIIHYDKNIIGNTIIEPGEADAGVFTPLIDLQSYVHAGKHPEWTLRDSDKLTGVAVSADGNGRYGRISPYLQGVNAVVESMRNVTSTGAYPAALTDCLNYGNPEIPEQMWQFAEGVRGIAEAARGIIVNGEYVPVISGNVSLYNGKPDGNAIDPTAIVCSIGIIADAGKAITMSFKKAGSSIFLIGERMNECGGSVYYQMLEELSVSKRDSLIGINAPNPDFEKVSRQISAVTIAIGAKYMTACHDISNGGLLLALFEMTLPFRKTGGEIGAIIDIGNLAIGLRNDQILFSETGGFIAEVPAEKESAFIALSKKESIYSVKIGKTQEKPEIEINSGSQRVFHSDLDSLKNIWSLGLKKAMFEH